MFTRAVFAIACWSIAFSAWAAAPPVYTFGIGPVQSSTELARRWVPLLRHLSSVTGYELRFQTALDITTFQTNMVAGDFDFAFINPYHYLQSNLNAGYAAFAKEKNGTLTGIVVTRKDAPLDDIAQLDGLAVAFPAPNALAATWMPMRKMKELHVRVEPHYVNSLESVYLSVARGLFPAGGGEMRTFNALPPETRGQLKVIWHSVSLPPFAFAAHPRIPKQVVQKVQQALIDMASHPGSKALLQAVNLGALEKAGDADYNGLRTMQINPSSIQ